MTRWKRYTPVIPLVVGIIAASPLVLTLEAQDGAAPQAVRVDIAGNWQVVAHEDAPDFAREPGSEFADFTGIPLSAAGRQKAQTWAGDLLSQPERQTEAHPVHYIGNNRGPQRILRILDPATQALVAYAMSGSYRRADRVVWLDGRPHPSKISEHTRDGFSTGTWDNNGALVVTTTHMKTGSWAIRRNGVAISPYAKMTEYFSRSGDLMTVLIYIEDPVYLEEPMIRSYTLRANPVVTLDAASDEPAEAGEEVLNKETGWVPHWPLGTKHTDFAEKFGLPYEATIGGKETLYPEYLKKLQQMMKSLPRPTTTSAAR